MKPDRSHLVPARVLNKNGVLTTVHKKQSKEAISPAMPDPVLATPAINRDALEHETATALTDTASVTGSHYLMTDYAGLRSILPSYGIETLQRIIDASKTDLRFELLRMILHDKHVEGFINDWITIEPLCKELEFWSALTIRGFVKYNHLAAQSNGHYPKRRAVQAKSIVRVTAYLEANDATRQKEISTGVAHNGNTIEYIKNKKLRHLLSTVDDPTVVADIVVHRGIIDPEHISTLLSARNNTANAINEGIL